MKKWEILYQRTTDDKQLSTEELIDILLLNRSVKDKKERDAFLHPDITSISLQSVGINEKAVEKAITRIQKAIKEGEQMIVYGDYDVDGITASAIIWETLHDMKGAIMPYIPSRMDEGYGLSVVGIENLLKKHPDTKLIITVDNGIVANDAVDFANKKGIDVIITDHHVVNEGEGLPDAFAIIHTTSLCGAGIAWLFSRNIQYPISNIQYQIEDDEHLELAALGTVADLVPLKGANRTIVKFGIEKLSRTTRPGLTALFQEAGCDASTLGVYQIGHIIAPRLNATGRIEHAMDSLRLLCTRDAKRAFELANKLGVTNRQRQMIMRSATEHAVEKVRSQETEVKSLIIIDDESYQEGVIGLVAGKLVEEFYRPSIVISKKEKVSKGSVRSVAGFDIIDFLRTQGKDVFVNVGGHPMAAGFTIETDKIVMLKNILEMKASEIVTEDLLQRTVKIDCKLPFSLINSDLYRSIQSLSPFGMNNYEPVFQTDEVTIVTMKIIGKEGTHLRMTLKKDGKSIEAIAFGMGEQAKVLRIGDHISVAYIVDENEWNGNKKLQLKIKDIKAEIKTF